jgi:predicted RNA binding protein YcfA (HicA-like mRNA interferase family)
MKGREMMRVLTWLGYEADTSSGGSHGNLPAPGRPPLTYAVHDGKEISPNLVWKILVKQAGLTVDQAKEALKHA